MKCTDCPYYWRDNDGENEYCHYKWDDGCAPCEIEDYETEDIDED